MRREERHSPARRAEIPVSLKISYTLFLGVLVAVYLRDYGPGNFLWFSDLALLVLLIALWRESALLSSMAAVGTLVFELGWNFDFLTGGRLVGGVDYMFDPAMPLYLRGLSLFHVALPVLQIWLIYRLGYDGRALYAQTLAVWIVLPLTYLLTEPADNVNWAFGLGGPQSAFDPLVYLAFLMVALPLVVCVPTHLVLQMLFGAREREAPRDALELGLDERHWEAER